MPARRLKERQVHWSRLLSQFNLKLLYRLGWFANRPSALSRRDHDMPKSADDERIKNRGMKLIKDQLIIKHKSVVVSSLKVDKKIFQQGNQFSWKST